MASAHPAGSAEPPKSLAETFERANFKLEYVSRIVIEGDEPARTSGVTISLTWKPLFSKFFGFFDGAGPYKHWLSSGNRRLHLFTAGSDVRPFVTLHVNETDWVATSLDEHTYRCKGLHAFISRFLDPIAQIVTER